MLILLPFEDQMRREAELVQSNHVLFMCEDDMPADIELPDIDIVEVTHFLTDQGVERGLAAELGKASGDSLKKFQRVALQRNAPQPAWSAAFTDRAVRRAWLLRSWTTVRSGDLDAFERLVGTGFDAAEESLRQAARGADPVFSRVGPVWSVVSPADFWDHVRPHLTASDFEALERTVQDVLGAVDPALELPPEERWLAGMRGMTPIHSRELRRGLATTLALVGALAETTPLGVNGTGGAWVQGVIHKLLTRANGDDTGQLWASLTDVLPLLAEASPDAFLGSLDQAIASSRGALSQMFGDTKANLLTSGSPHTGLVWALEVTAWLPAQFGQAVNALAALSEMDPGGRLSNRPFGSLKDIFRLWLPQTLVNRSGRLASLAALAERYPAMAARLLVELLPSGHDTATTNAKPRFREGITEPQPVNVREWTETTTAIVSMLLPMMPTLGTLWPDFLGHLNDLPAPERDRVYAVLPVTIEALKPDERTALWEKASEVIRRHREYPDAPWALLEEDLARFEAAIVGAKPTDPRDEARWLFDETHPDVGVRKANDLGEYDREVAAMRAAIVRRILNEQGIDGVEGLARIVKFPHLVGVALAEADR